MGLNYDIQDVDYTPHSKSPIKKHREKPTKKKKPQKREKENIKLKSKNFQANQKFCKVLCKKVILIKKNLNQRKEKHN